MSRGRSDLGVDVPTLEPGDEFLARLADRAALARPVRVSHSWSGVRLAAATALLTAVTVGGAWATGTLVPTAPTDPRPAEQRDPTLVPAPDLIAPARAADVLPSDARALTQRGHTPQTGPGAGRSDIPPHAPAGPHPGPPHHHDTGHQPQGQHQGWEPPGQPAGPHGTHPGSPNPGDGTGNGHGGQGNGQGHGQGNGQGNGSGSGNGSGADHPGHGHGLGQDKGNGQGNGHGNGHAHGNGQGKGHGNGHGKTHQGHGNGQGHPRGGRQVVAQRDPSRSGSDRVPTGQHPTETKNRTSARR